jgi:transcriptional regulator with XRE-family HTH domain
MADPPDETGVIATVARNVRDRRLVARMSQEALADAAGLDRTYISQIERRKKNVTVAVVARIARALATLPHTLLMDDPAAPRPRRKAT